jgi:hypothetical protein
VVWVFEVLAEGGEGGADWRRGFSGMALPKHQPVIREIWMLRIPFCTSFISILTTGLLVRSGISCKVTLYQDMKAREGPRIREHITIFMQLAVDVS